MSEKNDNKKEKKSEGIDARFLLGLVLIVFLVLVHTLVSEIPLYLIAVPALLMNVDLKSLVDLVKVFYKK